VAKIANPIRFSEQFGLNPSQLDALRVLDPTLNADTNLFIDPLLLIHSQHPEISHGALASYEQHFTTVIKLLRASKQEEDVPWRNASRLLSFFEIKWTCLGYGAQSVSGSGSGSDMIVKTAKEIVDLGVEDPDLFVAMALFEEGFGPDRISDMTTNVILGDLLALNARILPSLGVPLQKVTGRLRNGTVFDAQLPINPFVKGVSPIVLVPDDILRDLPIAKDWSEVADAASKNQELRRRVNDHIAELWKSKTLKDKDEVRKWALSNRDAFETLLEMLHGAECTAYDVQGDPKGELFWRGVAASVASLYPLIIKPPARLDMEGVVTVVEEIIEQFRFLIEDRRYSEELYYEDDVRPEKAAQRLFFAVAYAYCKSNNLDITPEADTGNGPVDFKIASGFNGRVLVEIKLSTNNKLLRGYFKQLEAYKTAEETIKSYYVVIDVGKMGKKAKTLNKLHDQALERGETVSPLVFIEGIRRPSASKL
jgi:hypothetical protein